TMQAPFCYVEGLYKKTFEDPFTALGVPLTNNKSSQVVEAFVQKECAAVGLSDKVSVFFDTYNSGGVADPFRRRMCLPFELIALLEDRDSCINRLKELRMQNGVQAENNQISREQFDMID